MIKKIENTEYGIEEDGTVWRLEGKPWRGMEPPYKLNWHDNGYGYKTVNLHGSVNYIHRLVAKYFLPNPESLGYVGHKDHNKANNHVDNLYWTSASHNTKHGVRDGKINYKGRCNGSMKHHSDQVLCKAYAEAKQTGLITGVGSKYGVNRTTLSSWINKRSRQELTDLIDLELEDYNKHLTGIVT